MLRYFVKRILSTIPVLLIISVIVFSMIHLTPGDPAQSMLGPEASEEQVEYRAVDEGGRAPRLRRRRGDVPAAAAEELSGAGTAGAEAGCAGDASEEPVGVGGAGERESRCGEGLRDGPGGGR